MTMHDWFGVTGSDIQGLDPEALRELLAKLCEADYRAANLSTSGITWGGNQTAPDGGVDIRLKDTLPSENSFIKRQDTIIQVKKSKMPPAEIAKEMRCKESHSLKPVIKDLIQQKGAYIIASGEDSLSDSSLNVRITKMREIVSQEAGNETLLVDFFDQNRIASWVRKHPALISFVRAKNGSASSGWCSYGNWSYADKTLKTYVFDDTPRVDAPYLKKNNRGSVLDGIQWVRSVLASPGTSVRLIGLSGVGKTRFSEALFDSRIGDMSLDPNAVIYADSSTNPSPSPLHFIPQIKEFSSSKMILVIDNCSSELHGQLTALIKDSSISILTIEYDIRDDQPEATTVFKLLPASDPSIETLLSARYPNIGERSRDAIARFSGGNARIAFAVANTFSQDESNMVFDDETLFKRLFWQKCRDDSDLLTSAKICALVYSFDGETETEGSELCFLASLASQDLNTLFRNIQTLSDRDLLQLRGVWRAVLPQAIANRLAKKALEEMRPSEIDRFFSEGPERLRISFTRRLGYLPNSPRAIDMAERWLGKFSGTYFQNLTDVDMTLLRNIAPIVQSAVVAFIESQIPDYASWHPIAANKYRLSIVFLLRHLAYEPQLFSRCAKLLVKYGLSADGDTEDRALCSLFMIFFSNTLASFQDRREFIEILIAENTDSLSRIVITILDAALEVKEFICEYAFDFGIESRSRGYEAKTGAEIGAYLDFCISALTKICCGDTDIAEHAKDVFIRRLSSLWAAECYDILERSIKTIHAKEAWHVAYQKIQKIVSLEPTTWEPIKEKERLTRLGDFLAPQSLLDHVHVSVFSDGPLIEGDDELTFKVNREKWEAGNRDLGVRVSQNETVFTRLLPLLVSKLNGGLWEFGEGLAKGTDNRAQMFDRLYKAFKDADPQTGPNRVFYGFLSWCGVNDRDIYDVILNSLLEDPLLGSYLPDFDACITPTKQSFLRLNHSLDANISPISIFKNLAHNEFCKHTHDDDLADLLKKIVLKEGGLDVALSILVQGRVVVGSKTYSENLKNIALDVILRYPFENRKSDYHLSILVRVFLRHADGLETTVKIVRRFSEKVNDRSVRVNAWPRFLDALMAMYPEVFLNDCLGRINRLFFRDFACEKGFLDKIPDSVLLKWCRENPDEGFQRVVAAARMFKKSSETGVYQWQPIAYRLLDVAPNLQGVLEALRYGIYPSSWIGSYADTLERRLVLFQELERHRDPAVREWAIQQRNLWHQRVIDARGRESPQNENTGFE